LTSPTSALRSNTPAKVVVKNLQRLKSPFPASSMLTTFLKSSGTGKERTCMHQSRKGTSPVTKKTLQNYRGGGTRSVGAHGDRKKTAEGQKREVTTTDPTPKPARKRKEIICSLSAAEGPHKQKTKSVVVNNCARTASWGQATNRWRKSKGLIVQTRSWEEH